MKSNWRANARIRLSPIEWQLVDEPMMVMFGKFTSNWFMFTRMSELLKEKEKRKKSGFKYNPTIIIHLN